MAANTQILSTRGDVVLPIAPGFVDGTAITNTVLTGITAGTTHTLAGATPLTGQINHITTCGVSADAVALPAANAAAIGDWIVVINRGAAPAAVWPQAADAIDGGTAGAAVVLTNAKRVIFFCTALNVWDSFGGGVSA